MEESNVCDAKMALRGALTAPGYGCHVVDLRTALRDLPSGSPRLAQLEQRNFDPLDTRRA